MNELLHNAPLMWGIGMPIWFIWSAFWLKFSIYMKSTIWGFAVWMIAVFVPLWGGLIIKGLGL